MTIAVFEFMDKAPEEYSTDERLDAGFLHPHVKWYQGDSMEVINSLAAYFFRAQELLVERGRSREEDCIWML